MRAVIVALTLLIAGLSAAPARAAVIVTPPSLDTGKISFDIATLVIPEGSRDASQTTPSVGRVAFNPVNPAYVTPVVVGEPFAAVFNVVGFGFEMDASAHVTVDVSAKSATHDYGSEQYTFDLTCNTTSIGSPALMTCAGVPGNSSYHKFGAFESVLLSNLVAGSPETIEFSYTVSETMNCVAYASLLQESAGACVSGSVTVTDLAGQPDPTWTGRLTVTPAPEPASMLLLGSGLAGIIAIGRRRRAA